MNKQSVGQVVVAVVAALGWASSAGAQERIQIPPAIAPVPAAESPKREGPVFAQRGFIEGQGVFFPQAASNDPTRRIADGLFREEVFAKPARWIQFAAGLDLRANSDRQIEDSWRLDVSDRGALRPRMALRRLSATITTPHFTLDMGKQFIRWGQADILTPTDRFTPRDYMNVIDTEFLPVIGVRPSLRIAKETVEVVWVPRLTPSRLPRFDQRWTVVPPEAVGIPLEDGGLRIPHGSQVGVRWLHSGDRFESALSYFDGFNHLPNIESRFIPSRRVIELTRVYPDLREYGGELLIPTGLVTLKSEAAYFTSPTRTSEEYVLYVVELERQIGEWVLDGGYAGEVVTSTRSSFPFAADRGMARSVIGRVAYTVNPRRTIAIEGAARQSGKGLYTKGEFSEAIGQRWRLTITAVGIGGEEDDFIGQYSRNSHGVVALRFSF